MKRVAVLVGFDRAGQRQLVDASRRGEWPGNGEIDILEYYRRTMLANFGWGSTWRWVATWNIVRAPVESFARGSCAEGERDNREILPRHPKD